MKKLLLLFIAGALALGIAPLTAAPVTAGTAKAQSVKKAKLPKLLPQVTPVKKYTPPALTMEGGWTMVIVGDTQGYCKFLRNQGILDMMLCWIVKNIDTLNIQQLLFTGDMVDQNRSNRIRFPRKNDQTGLQQWQALSRIISRLDGQLPYVLATGNHDYGNLSAEDRSTELNKYFPPERNSKLAGVLAEMGANAAGEKNLENAAYKFTTPNGQKLLVVSIGFAPTDAQLKWANEVFTKYSDHFGILLTHSYLRGFNDGRVGPEKYLISRKDGNSGEEIFQKLVRKTPNIRMVICGHICKKNSWEASTNFQISKNDAGKEVYEMLFNTQTIGGGFNGNGGDGWMRLLEFSKDMKTIKVRTFSPFFASSPSTCKLAWQNLPRNKFVINVKD